MFDGLVFDVPSFLYISQCSIQDDWFQKYEIPNSLGSVKRVVVDSIVYFIDQELRDEDVPLVIIDISPKADPIFKGDKVDRYCFDRIATIVRSTFTNSVAIPFNWHSHGDGSLRSVYAANKVVGGGARIHFDTNPAGNKDLLVFGRTDEFVEFRNLFIPNDLYLSARSNLKKAILQPPPPKKNTATGINLSRRLPESFIQGANLQNWYSVKLTEDQRAFVDKPYDGPVRLRGAAGTGKTLALVVKFLFDGCTFERASEEKRLGFLTHSSATADLVNSICVQLDPMGLLAGQGKHTSLQVRTLYELASEYLRFDLDRLNPLSIDGREGRQLQSEIIRSELNAMRDRITLARYDVSNDIKAGWMDKDGSPSRNKLVLDLMNEFASILDADGVWAGTEKAAKYVKSPNSHRPTWLMALPTEWDRRFVLEINRRYRTVLAEMNTLSVDQMIADFNSFLDHNTWDQLRKTKGFDAIFVDELHLFTSLERQVLHKLIRNTITTDGTMRRPPIFMAYDVKQSPRDTFTNFGEGDTSLFSASTQLQNSDLVRLTRVFRYTPQIADFLYDLDATFPAINVADEWEEYAAKAEVADGERPTLTIFKDEAELYRRVFDAAVAKAKKIGGQKVAILCLNEELFDRYSDISKKRYEGELVYVDSREPNLDLKHSGKRATLSMPEYVAGLQFETVYLIHADADDSPRDMNIGDSRRLISTAYLGASRAEKELHISCCDSRGGPASILDMALARGTLSRLSR